MEEISDQQLLQLYVQEGSQAAFRSLEGRYSGMVYGVAMRRLGRHDLAAEVAQEVFVFLAQRAAELHGKALGAWLHQVCIHKASALAKLERRQRERAAAYAQLHQTDAEHIESAQETESLLRRLDEAIDNLPAADRELILLRYMERLDAVAIGNRLGLEPTVCQKRLERARAKLAKLLALPLTSVALEAALDRVGADVMTFSLWQSKTSLPPQGSLSPSHAGRWAAVGAGVIGMGALWLSFPSDNISVTAMSHQASRVASSESKPTPATSLSEVSKTTTLQTAPFSLTKLAGLMEAADEGDSTAGIEASEMLAPMSGAGLEAAMAEIPSLALSLNQLRLVALGTLARLVELDGERAVRIGTQFWRGFAGASAPRLCALIAAGWHRWSLRDSVAARNWWQQAEAEQLFAPKGEVAEHPIDDASLAKALEATRAATTSAQRVTLAQATLAAEPVSDDLPSWSALSDVLIQKLPEPEARALVDELLQNSPTNHQLQLAAFRLRVASAPGRPPSIASLDWAVTTKDISHAAVLGAWLQRDLPGTIQWLESLTEADHSRIIEILEELLHPTSPTKH
jgi:RNA polymerase sigma-70 factor (ECF subfamily)